jgi:hypothetical protein
MEHLAFVFLIEGLDYKQEIKAGFLWFPCNSLQTF